MQIKYYIKQAYGNEFMYISDAAIATAFKKLLGGNRKTITKEQMQAMEQLGFTFIKVTAPTK